MKSPLPSVEVVPYALAVLATLVGYVYPEYYALLLVVVGIAAYTFIAPKPQGETELLLTSFFSGAACHWAAGRALGGGTLIQMAFTPYAIWGLALGLSVVAGRESGERSGYAFALGALVLPVALGPHMFGSRLDALVLAALFLVAGAILAVRLTLTRDTGAVAVLRASLIAAVAASIFTGVAILIQLVSAYSLPDMASAMWLYANLVWYALIPSSVAIAGLSLLYHSFFTKEREKRLVSIAPAVFEE